MSSKTSRATRIWARMILFTTIIMYAICGVALAVSMMAEEISVVRANTTNEVSTKATMPEISIEELEATLIMYSAYEEELEPEPITEYVTDSTDTFWSIAEEIYGNGCYYPYLMKINNRENDILYEGQTLIIEYFDESEADNILDECYQFMENQNKKSKPKTSSGNVRNYNKPDNMTYVGNYKITGYDPYCVHCCGKSDGITASGKKAQIGRTIAAKGFSYGTRLYIEGYGTYTVEDSGGFKKSTIDIAASSHDECYTLTGHNVSVYIVN